MASLALRSALGATSRPYRCQRSPTHVLVWKTCRSVSTPAPHEFTPHSNAHDPGPALLSSNASSSPPPLLKYTGGPGSRQDHIGELSDQEWEIRTGRGIYVLQQTLPTFFSTGLISSVDTAGSSSSRAKDDSDDTTIYSPNIRLTYRPPTPIPHPFPRTLQVEGLSLYLASSVLLRHTLNALYTDLRVELQRVRVHGPRSSSTSGLSADEPHTSEPHTRSIREKSLFINLSVRGTNRVSKAEAGWEVNSTYTFSPVTGLIHLHTIDSIHPAPHQAFFDALQAALSKIGLGGSSNPGEGAGAGGMARTSSKPLPHAAAGRS